MPGTHPTDDDLNKWISDSKRWQSRLLVVIIAVAVGGAVVIRYQSFVGKMMFLVAALLGICGYWISGGHINEWRKQLAARARSRQQ